MTSPTQPTPEEIAAVESLVEPVVCANSGGENEYERLPTIMELALRLRALRAESWQSVAGSTLGFFLLQRGDSYNEHTLHVFETSEARDAKTKELIYGTDELCPDDQCGLALYLEELREDGSVEFEGDPGLEWFCAHSDLAAAVARADRAQDGIRQIEDIAWRSVANPGLEMNAVEVVEKLQQSHEAAVARAVKAEAALNNCEVEVGRVTELAATGIHSCAAQAEEIKRLRSLLQQMLDVAENADETGYVTDCGFVDLDKLHDKVRAALSAAPVVAKEGK